MQKFGFSVVGMLVIPVDEDLLIHSISRLWAIRRNPSIIRNRPVKTRIVSRVTRVTTPTEKRAMPSPLPDSLLFFTFPCDSITVNLVNDRQYRKKHQQFQNRHYMSLHRALCSESVAYHYCQQP